MASSNDERSGVIEGKSFDEIDGAVLRGVTFDNLNAVMRGVIFTYRGVALRGKPYSDMFSVSEGKPYSDKGVVTEGHLIMKDLTLKYNINRLALTITQVPTDFPAVEQVQADVSYYEEGIKPLYIMWSSGRTAYEYFPDTKTIAPIQSDLPNMGDFELTVFGQGINDYDEKQAAIKKINETNFDGMLRRAFADALNEKSYTLTLHYGIKGTYSKVWCIMRVKASSERRAWILGKPYPVLLVGTDFGLYVLRTTARWLTKINQRFAVMRGFASQKNYIWAILHGILIELRYAIMSGKPYSERWAISKGKPYNDIGGILKTGLDWETRWAIMMPKYFSDMSAIMRAMVWSIDGWAAIRGYLYRDDNDAYGITWGRDTWDIFLGNNPTAHDHYESDYDGVWIPKIAIGTDHGLAILASDLTYPGRTNDIDSILRGVIFSNRYAIMDALHYADRWSVLWGKMSIYDDREAILRGVTFNGRDSILGGKASVYSLRYAVIIGAIIEIYLVKAGGGIPEFRGTKDLGFDATSKLWAASEVSDGVTISYSEDEGSTWFDYTTLTGTYVDPSIAVDNHRNVHFVCHSTASSGIMYKIFGTELGQTLAWEYASISGANYYNTYPALAVDNARNAYVAWCSASGVSLSGTTSGTGNIWFRRRTMVVGTTALSGTWGDIEQVTTITSGGQTKPALALSLSGTISSGTVWAHIAWMGMTHGSSPDNYSIRYRDGAVTG